MSKSTHLTFLGLCRISLISLFLTHCGINLGSGSGSIPNDAAPQSGLIVSQGTFFGKEGSAQGSAILYFANGENIIRLDSVSFTEESGLQLKVIASNAQTVASFSLRSSSGSQNYSFAVTTGVKVSRVEIYSTLSQSNYASAQLQGQTTSQFQGVKLGPELEGSQ